SAQTGARTAALAHTPRAGGIVGSVPSVFGSLIVRKDNSTVWPAYAARLQVSAFQPPESPLKPGRVATTDATPPGWWSVRVSVQARLLYVAPPSVETWT